MNMTMLDLVPNRVSIFCHEFGHRLVNTLAITDDDVRIEYIAHMLSRQCRFGGAVPGFYSVAEHSVIASCYGSNRMHLLLHDGHEQIYQDIIRPNKVMMSADYAERCHNLDYRIFRVHGVETTAHSYAEVKQVDSAMLIFELNWMYNAGLPVPSDWKHKTPLFVGLDPDAAYTAFMRRYEQLRRERAITMVEEAGFTPIEGASPAAPVYSAPSAGPTKPPASECGHPLIFRLSKPGLVSLQLEEWCTKCESFIG